MVLFPIAIKFEVSCKSGAEFDLMTGTKENVALNPAQ
jgi:hypothetical protein